MAEFANVAEFRDYIGDPSIEFTDARALLLLRAASEAIRNYTGQRLDFVADDEITMVGRGLPVLFLPELPVVDLTVLEVDGEALVEGFAEDYTWTPAGLLTRAGGGVWDWESSVAATYSHGYETIPNDLRLACLQMAAKWLNSPDSPGPLTAESIGDYAKQMGRTAELSLVTDERLLAPYRMPQLA